MSTIIKSTILSVNENILSTDIDNELVLMSIETGSYFGLNAVGLRIWELAKTPTSADAIINQLLQEFNVSNEQCEREVLSLLNKMLEKGLIVTI